MDKTRMFNLKEIEDALVETTLDEVRESLREKGYNPVNQIVGYLVTGDETFITNYNRNITINEQNRINDLVNDFISLKNQLKYIPLVLSITSYYFSYHYYYTIN